MVNNPGPDDPFYYKWLSYTLNNKIQNTATIKSDRFNFKYMNETSYLNLTFKP